MAKTRNQTNTFFTDMESFVQMDRKVSVPTSSTPLNREGESAEGNHINRSVELPKKRERRSARIPLLVPPSVKKGMEEVAEREDRSVNDIINELLKDYLKKEGCRP